MKLSAELLVLTNHSRNMSSYSLSTPSSVMDSHGNMGHKYIQTRIVTRGSNHTKEHRGTSDLTHQGSPTNLPRPAHV